jgi:hypothetical protein
MEALGGRLLEFLSRYLEAEVAVMYAAERTWIPAVLSSHRRHCRLYGT